MSPVTEATPAVKLTDRINRIEPSATMAVVAEADKLRQQGIDVVDFGAGEPHFSTPQHVKDAAISAIQGNFSKYTAVGGIPELVTHGEDGLIFDSGRIEDLTAMLRLAAGDQSLREKLQAQAVETARQRFSIAVSTRRVESLYEELLSSANSR